MRICVLHRYPISLARGTNSSFPLFVKKLVSRGDEVIFVSFKETEEGFGLDGVETREISLVLNRASAFGKLFKSLLFVLVAPFIVWSIHKQQKVDLVYCDDSLPFYAFLIKKIARTKTIMRLGDLQSAYIFADGSLVKKLIFGVVFCLEKMMWKNMDKVVVISRAFEDFLIENGIPPAKIANVPECIDLEMFKPREKSGRIRERYQVGNAPLVMFHGLVAKMKGLDTLLRAIPEALKEIPQAKFMIAGDGTELKRLKRLAKELSIEQSVVFAGWVPFSEIPEYLAECDVGVPMRSGNLGNNFVVTSALLQYWAMGKPIVAPNLLAIRHIVKEKENGVLFEPDNAQDLSKKIVYLLRSLSRSAYMGRHGRIIVEQSFGAESVAQKMQHILEGN